MDADVVDDDEYDAINDETFGGGEEAEAGWDWDEQQDVVHDEGKQRDRPKQSPNNNNIPDNHSQNQGGRNVTQTTSHRVDPVIDSNDNDFEDPAIIVMTKSQPVERKSLPTAWGFSDPVWAPPDPSILESRVQKLESKPKTPEGPKFIRVEDLESQLLSDNVSSLSIDSPLKSVPELPEPQRPAMNANMVVKGSPIHNLPQPQMPQVRAPVPMYRVPLPMDHPAMVAQTMTQAFGPIIPPGWLGGQMNPMAQAPRIFRQYSQIIQRPPLPPHPFLQHQQMVNQQMMMMQRFPHQQPPHFQQHQGQFNQYPRQQQHQQQRGPPQHDSGDRDEYAGLMSPQEIDWLLKIQRMQIENIEVFAKPRISLRL